MSKKASEWLGNYTPAPDAIAQKHGAIAALVFGNVWRFENLSKGYCDASVKTQAERLGFDDKTVAKWLAKLSDPGEGYLVEIKRAGMTSVYRTTNKCQIEDRVVYHAPEPTPNLGEVVTPKTGEVTRETPTPKTGEVKPEPTPNLGKDLPQNWVTRETKRDKAEEDKAEGEGARRQKLEAPASLKSQPPAPRKAPVKKHPVQITEHADKRIADYIDVSGKPITPNSIDTILERVSLERASVWRETLEAFAGNGWRLDILGNVLDAYDKRVNALRFQKAGPKPAATEHAFAAYARKLRGESDAPIPAGEVIDGNWK